jgi:N-acetylglucosaminyldiphosphoundecaprenol N-acetyl-beta-D-mannosaminyltransferase
MNRVNILTMDVDVTALEDAVNFVHDLCDQNVGAYVCVSNVHMCMETYDAPDFAHVVNQADLIIPDGKPLSVAQRLLGYTHAKQVRGQDIMTSLCELSGKETLNIGLYGGSSNQILDLVKANIIRDYPNVHITFAYAPPFRSLTEDEDANVIHELKENKVDILFVGIGCPKQELWMAEHKDKVNCVMLGVGAAFDFIAGNKKHAPRWIQSIGMEWFFRLASEPKRLWKRYLKHNPRFLFLFSLQLLKLKVFTAS